LKGTSSLYFLLWRFALSGYGCSVEGLEENYIDAKGIEENYGNKK